MTTVLTTLQGLALLAVLVGVALALPLWAALVVDGVIVLVVSTAAEHIVRKARSAPQDRRSGPIAAGVE